MGFIRWLIGGLVGAAIGITVWVLIGYFANAEIGWIAWGIGFVVGVGVRYGAYLSDQEESFGQGVTAVVLAVGAIVLAKFIVFSLLTGGNDSEALREIVSDIKIDDQAMISRKADEIVEELEANGQTVQWPDGMTYDEASKREDYPPRIWSQAEARWNQLGTEGQQEERLAVAQFARMLSEAASGPEFSDFFSPWDLLWMGLAAFTAFRIGVGSYDED